MFFIIATAHFLALLSPGPDFFLILKTATTHGRLNSLILCLGIATGHLLYLILVFFGFGLFNQLVHIFIFIQFIGMCYLVYLAVSLYQSSQTQFLLQPQHAHQIQPLSWFKAFIQGCTISLLNPKNALFYAALVSILGHHISLATQLFYIIWMTSIVLVWDCILAIMFTQSLFLKFYARWMPILQKITALIFIGFATLIFVHLLQYLNG